MRLQHSYFPGIALAVVSLILASSVLAQGYLNPYAIPMEPWAELPGSRTMGAVGDIDVDPDGEHMWAVVRCDATAPNRFGDECVDSDLDSVLKFNSEGRVVESFGGGMFIWPHGIDVDSEGNVWVTDAVNQNRIPSGDNRGHIVVKFSPTGEVLMVLGTPGEQGPGPDHFTSPADVVIGDNGNIFVADGHYENGNSRVAKFDRNGNFIKQWGKTGYAPGEFRVLHTIAIDRRGRLFVGDRSNNRIQLFDQEGEFINSWTQFGRPSGIFFDEHDHIYVADSESDDLQNPGWEMGIRIGDANLGWVDYFVQLPYGDPRNPAGNGAEFVAVDSAGNMYGGEPRPRKLQKYMRVRP
ncbi:MAG: peptidyl-alpha-hydroxyglycine alpha-amidating lyase family protein [Gammaproteobacteria bacterium]|nr:peptidyl-alpha-hydroxyglycine alpha-amidating lyase family protein [Gammaproteobacteria bacterium]